MSLLLSFGSIGGNFRADPDSPHVGLVLFVTMLD